MDFGSAIGRVREIISSANLSKSQDPIVNKAIFAALCALLETIQSGSTAESVLLAQGNLTTIEDVCSCKFLVIGKSIQSMIVAVYDAILSKAPGYAVRNCINSMLQIFGNKLSTIYSRDCSLAVIGKLMETRSFDCGSQINDIVAVLLRAVKGNDISSRLVALFALISLVMGAGSRINDCHNEIVRTCSKYNTDRNADVRCQVGSLLAAIARNSSGGSSVPPETIVPSLVKGLEDENIVVQDTYVRAYASLLSEQFRAYLEHAEKAKIGLARGSDAPAQPKRRLSVAMPKLSITTPKKLVDDFQFRNVVTLLVRGITKSVGTLRNGYIAVMSHFVRESLSFLEQTDLDWLVNAMLDMFRDPSITVLSYEEIIYLKARIGNIFSGSIAKELTEAKLLQYAGILIAYVANMDTRGEYELQLALSELCHVLLILGEAAVAIVDEIQASILVHLRHSSFGVRSASAHVICGLAGAVPGIAASLLRASFAHAKELANNLGKFEVYDSSYVSAAPLPGGPSSLNASGHSADITDDNPPTDPSRRRNPKESERLQRMYYFHGHTLVISLFMKNENKLVSGIPSQLIQEIFDFGLELINLEVLSVHFSVRNVCCSMLRAGSLIVSSCLNRGYAACKNSLSTVLQKCDKVFSEALPSEGSKSSNLGADDLLFELMGVEAALVCIATLLWSCPNALEHEEDCLATVIEGLEKAFKLVKSKYQPRFRNHFRFRILQTIVLECFAWLPPGSFPNSCQVLFIESLRVFRDAIGNNSECSCLSDIVEGNYAVLNMTTSSTAANSILKLSGLNCPDIPSNIDMLMLRLESYAVVLPRKESEALLAFFNKDQYITREPRAQYLPGVEWSFPRPPCYLIDSRTIDAAIGVVSTTFGHQTIEFQEKCINLCIQMVSSLSKSSSMSMFSSDEEKRKRERKLFVTIKGVASCMFSIVKSFPFVFYTSPSLNLSWAQTVVDSLLEYTNNSCLEIRIASSQAVSYLAANMTRSSLLDSVFSRISSAISLTADKKGADLTDMCGSMIALGELWSNASSRQSLQKNICAYIIDCLRRTDLSLSFRSHGVIALASIIRRALLLSSADDSDFFTLIDRVCHCVEVNLVSVQGTEDGEVLFTSLTRLCAEAIFSILAKYSENGEALVGDIDVIFTRLLRAWSTIRECYYHEGLQLEAMNLLVLCCKFPVFQQRVSVAKISQIANSVVHNCFITNNISVLDKVVDTVQILSLLQPVEAFENGIDVLLFKVLNWLLSGVTCSSAVTFSGIDIRCCSQLGLSFGQDNAALALCGKIEAVIPSLYDGFTTVNPNANAMRSVLFLRSVALGLRSTQTSATSRASQGGNDMEDGADGEEEEGDANDAMPSAAAAVANARRSTRDIGGNGSSSSNSSNANSGTAANNNSSSSGAIGGVNWTVQQYCNKCRDLAVNRWIDAPTCFLRVKCLAVRIVALTLNQLTYGTSSAIHSDLLASRDGTRQALQTLTSNPSDDAVVQLPCYASLYIHDLVNLACACSTYTINDKVLQCLQAESILLLEKVILLFYHSNDPDAADAGDTAGNRIIAQFISQIVSAVRPCLGSSYSPILAELSSSVICLLIQGSFLSDKVAVRRLVKLLFKSTEENEKEKDSVAIIQTRAKSSTDKSDSLEVMGHIVEVAALAKLYLLTLHNSISSEVEQSVKSSIHSSIQEYVSSLLPVWYAMICDAVRVLQVLPPPGSATTASSTADGGAAAVDNGGTSAVEDVASASIWPEMTIETDPRRGGAVYSSGISYTELKPIFEKHLPLFLAAITSSKYLHKDNFKLLFSICFAALSDLCASYEDMPQLIRQSTANVFIARQSYLLLSITNLCKFESELQMSSSKSTHIPLVEWANTASTICFQLFSPKVVKYYTPQLLSSTIKSSIEILSFLFGFVTQMQLKVQQQRRQSSDTCESDVNSFLRTPTTSTPPSKRSPKQLMRIKTSEDVIDDTAASAAEQQLESLSSWLWTAVMVIGTRLLPFAFSSQAGSPQRVHAACIEGELLPLASTVSSSVNEASASTLLFLLTANSGSSTSNNDANPRNSRSVASNSGQNSSTSTSSNILTKYFFLLVKLSEIRSMEHKRYACRLVVCVLPAVSALFTKLKLNQQRDTLNGYVSEMLVELCKQCSEGTAAVNNQLVLQNPSEPSSKDIAIVVNAAAEVLWKDVLGLQLKLSESSSSAAGVTAFLSADGLSSVVDCAFYIWRNLCQLVPSLSDLSAVKHVSLMILQLTRSPTAFSKALLTNVVSSITSDAAKTGVVLMDAAFPAVLSVLCSSKGLDESVELMLVQLLFVCFNYCDDGRKALFIQTIMTPLCDILLSKVQVQESATALFVGKGMTLLAKTAAEPFRDSVALLSEQHRTALQQTMRIVLLQQQAAETMAANSAAANAPVKKIDMSRYKS